MAPDLTHAHWLKSSYSDNNGGNCVEIAPGFPGLVPVRDSKDPAGPALLFPTPAWHSFLTALRTETLTACG
ncbi:DUF397 domain-containing protein [Streptomyces sp. NBC_01476]|uniref:DUF397 domain-containing protein n=1 Tax=Streptomyces sp. NBC_01476 TaxID=2903881 RepID=UPI002E30607D|nr:DUF397 domain-containing protein [Streptomyces sp. NBC_01476]